MRLTIRISSYGRMRLTIRISSSGRVKADDYQVYLVITNDFMCNDKTNLFMFVNLFVSLYVILVCNLNQGCFVDEFLQMRFPGIQK